VPFLVALHRQYGVFYLLKGKSWWAILVARHIWRYFAHFWTSATKSALMASENQMTSTTRHICDGQDMLWPLRSATAAVISWC